MHRLLQPTNLLQRSWQVHSREDHVTGSASAPEYFVRKYLAISMSVVDVILRRDGPINSKWRIFMDGDMRLKKKQEMARSGGRVGRVFKIMSERHLRLERSSPDGTKSVEAGSLASYYL